jgi:signal transduction histidine kinase
MLSQRITKTCLLLTHDTDSIKKAGYRDLLMGSLGELKSSNTYLIHLKNSEEATASLNNAQPFYTKIVEIAEQFIAYKANDPITLTETLLTYELSFFQSMDNVVEQYVLENQVEITRFKYFIIFSNIAIILILTSLVILVINPAIIHNEKNTEIIRQQNADLSNLNATKNKLFSIIAHDLRTPFNGILGLTELLVSNIKEQDIKDIEYILNKIRLQSKNTYQLLENLLSWAKTQTGQISFNPENLDLKTAIDETIDILLPLAENKGITIQVHHSAGSYVFADADMLNTILRNLVTNAIKYSEMNSVVYILCKSTDGCTEITVTDHGTGMDEEELEKLFRQDVQRSKAGTQNERGTGLGLIICKEFIERHKGSISVESEVNKGSKFKFTIPDREVHTT